MTDEKQERADKERSDQREHVKWFYRGAAMMFLSGGPRETDEEALAELLTRADENGQQRAQISLKVSKDGPQEPLHADPSRFGKPETGIFVRAKVPGEEWNSVDIAHLTKESLERWLRSRGSIDFVISVVMSLLGHPRSGP